MAAATIDDYRWLIGPQAATHLERAADGRRSLVSLAKALRAELSAPRAHLVLETIELRRRARGKFAPAEQMFFTRQLLEQATGGDVAAYKASRFPEQGPIADLACGAGGDLLALSGRGPCLAVDQDPIALLLAEANCRICRCEGVQFRAADVRDFSLPGAAAWHLDPDRRSTGRRVTHVEGFEPGPAAVARLLGQCPHAVVKLAPATKDVPESWQEAEREWIGSRDECRQQVVWFGDLIRDAGLHAATVLEADGSSHRMTGEPQQPIEWSANVRRYVYEPHAAVLAAGLVGALARSKELATFSSSDGYLTGDQFIQSGLLTAFEVSEVLPWDVKRIKAVLRARGIGRLEIKHRGLAVDVPRWARQLKGSGASTATLLIAGAKPQAVAVLAQRLSKTEALRR